MPPTSVLENSVNVAFSLGEGVAFKSKVGITNGAAFRFGLLLHE